MNADFIIIGAGIAGASVAYELSNKGSVILLEREDLPGYHTTGRSAAMFLGAYGNQSIRALTAASRAFFDSPPPSFGSEPLLSPRGALFIGHEGQKNALKKHYEECLPLVPSVRLMDPSEAISEVKILKPEYVAGAVYEPDAMAIDVHAMHQGYLNGLKQQGAKLITDANVMKLSHIKGLWYIKTQESTFISPIVINAAGAWCDEIASLANIRPIGLVPKRRTAFIFDGPEDISFDNWPLVADIGEEFYIKPDAGRLLGSPADETPVPPQDVQPEDIDIATAVFNIEKAMNIKVTKILNKWAGLRSFVADNTLVAGFDTEADGFFWLAGQGGYGIQTAPAMATLCAAIATGDKFPSGIERHGITQKNLDPRRIR